MNASAGNGRSSDVGGRPFLALVSVTFITAGLLKSGEWICFPLLILGFTAAVLFAFHSRIRKLKIFDKLEMALAPEPEERPPPTTPQAEDPARPPTLGEIRAAAKNPATNRGRYGGRTR